MTTNVRSQIVTWAAWFVEHKGQIEYEEIRPFPLGAKLPMTNDCSATFTDLYYLAGAPDPNGTGYDGYGNTNSLAGHGQVIAQSQLLPGDAVIYYENGETAHVACVVTPGDDPMTMSHGWSGEPAYVKVSQDGRPHKFFRFAVNSRFPVPAPKPTLPAPEKTKPTPKDVSDANLVTLKNGVQARKAVANGWHLFYWATPGKWVAQVGGEPTKVALYANRDWRHKAV